MKYYISFFPKWVKEVFLPSVFTLARPIVLFADGHFEAFSEDVQGLLKDEGVYFCAMHSEDRNIIQPLDLMFHEVFKKEWAVSKGMLQKFLPHGGVIRSWFPTVYRDTWLRAYNAKALIDSFKRSGLWPWNSGSPKYFKVFLIKKIAT